MFTVRLLSAAVSVLGAITLLLPSAVSNATVCNASTRCVTERSLGAPSLISLAGSVVFAVVLYASSVRLLAHRKATALPVE
jgi:hypothetical protein